ncbi:MAG: hypothetical protein ACR2MD_09285 [Aridibacter sp.]
MKKTSLILISFLLILILGVCAFIFLGNSKVDNDVATLNLPITPPNECVEVKNFPANSIEISKIKKGKSGYFPDKTFAGGYEGADVFMNNWYGKHLKASNEKSLLETFDTDLEIYRFTWLRTFHHPVIVRLEKQKNEVKVIYKELDGAGGYEPGKIIKETENSINNKDWCKFIKLLNETDYWQMPTQKIDEWGNDGAIWILEGVKDNRYHSVDRWTPRKGNYREVGLFMLKLSDFDLDKNKDDLY